MNTPQSLDRPTVERPSGLGLGNRLRFLANWARRPLLTGAVAPSGRALAAAMASAVDPNSDAPVVELGPGTGVFTAAMLARGVAPSRIHAIEFNPDFARSLRRAFPDVNVIEGSAFQMTELLGPVAARPLSAVVSGLPLFTRPLHERKALILQAMALLEPGAAFAQFSYALVPPVKAAPEVFTLEVTPWIWANVPPARIWVYRRPA